MKLHWVPSKTNVERSGLRKIPRLWRAFNERGLYVVTVSYHENTECWMCGAAPNCNLDVLFHRGYFGTARDAMEHVNAVVAHVPPQSG